MLTATGHTYQLDLGIAGATPSDPSWLTGPLTVTYPIDVVTLAQISPTAARAVVRWRGPPGEIHVGDTVVTRVAGMELGFEPTVTVIGASELDLQLSAPPAPLSMYTQLFAAAAVLAAVVYFTHRIGSRRP